MSKESYEYYLNDQGVPDHEKASNGGRIPDRTQKYGQWLRKNDLTAFNVGYNEWRRENQK